jgi:hypothetical protein
MTYSLIQLAPGAYDLVLDGEVMGSVVRNGSRQPYTWTAELLPSNRSSMTFQPWKNSAPGLATRR